MNRLMPCVTPWGLPMLLAVALALPAHATTPVAGEVVLVAGPAFVQTASERAALQRGAKLLPGHTIITGEGGFAHVRMADGGMVAVRPLSEFAIDVFDYQGDATRDRVRYELREGVARSITGAVGEVNKDAFRLNTPVAAVGVRGTDFVVSTDDARSRIAVNSGAVVVAALGAGCSADAFGACTGSGLFLGAAPEKDGRYVEVAMGDPAPRIVQDPASSPDSKSMPHPKEPAVHVSSSSSDTANRSTTPTALELSPPRTAPPAPTPPAPPPTTVPATPIVIPATPVAPVIPPPELVATPAGAYWGRWDSKATLGDDGVALASQLRAAGRPAIVANSVYVGGLDLVNTNLPRTGQAEFLAAGGEGVLLSDKGDTLLSVGPGKLSVNFDSRTFDTQSRFDSADKSYATSASGTINARGFLHSDPTQSDSVVTGALGQRLDSAVTTVQRQFADGQLEGIVIWGQR